MIGSCSDIADFVIGGFPALFGAASCLISGELGLFFLEAPAVVAVDRVEAFALIAFIAGGGLGDGTDGVLVRVEARVALGADAFARPAMCMILDPVGAIRVRGRVEPRDLLILLHAPNARSITSLQRRQAPCIRPSR